nr:MAG TPA: hypothetical protein [Caudoviricetes sp.]
MSKKEFDRFLQELIDFQNQKSEVVIPILLSRSHVKVVRKSISSYKKRSNSL